MLILTRRVGETVMIGNDAKITILRVKGNKVRIGFNAPRHLEVHRQEIYERLQREKQTKQDLPRESQVMPDDTAEQVGSPLHKSQPITPHGAPVQT